MKDMIVSEDIVPLAQFKAHASEWLGKINTNKRSVVITQNGRPAGVLLAPEEFDRLSLRSSFFAAIERGIADSNENRCVDHQTLAAEITGRYGR